MRKEFDRFMANLGYCPRNSHGACSSGDTQWKQGGNTVELWYVEFKTLTKTKVGVDIYDDWNERKHFEFLREELDKLFPKMLNATLSNIKWGHKYQTMFDAQI